MLRTLKKVLDRTEKRKYNLFRYNDAGVAQSVEQLTCNQ